MSSKKPETKPQVVGPGTVVWRYITTCNIHDNRFGNTFRIYSDVIEYTESVTTSRRTKGMTRTYHDKTRYFLKDSQCYCEYFCDGPECGRNPVVIGSDAWLTKEECQAAVDKKVAELAKEHKEVHPNCTKHPCRYSTTRGDWHQIYYRYDKKTGKKYIPFPDPAGRKGQYATKEGIMSSLGKIKGGFEWEEP